MHYIYLKRMRRGLMDSYFNSLKWIKRHSIKENFERSMRKRDSNGKKNKKKKKHKKMNVNYKNLIFFFIIKSKGISYRINVIIIYFVLINQYRLYKI